MLLAGKMGVRDPKVKRRGGATAKGIQKAARAYKKAKLKTDYYNPEVHAAAFALPQWIKKLVP